MSSDKTKLKNTYFLCIHWCRKLTWDYSVKKIYIYIFGNRVATASHCIQTPLNI